MSDVVTILTVSGEFIGKMKEKKDNSVILENPRMLVSSGESMGFGYGVCVTGKNNPELCEFHNVVLVTETDPKFADAWRQAVTGITTAKQDIIV